MAVRINSSGDDLRRTANLPTATAFTIMGWARRVNAQTGSYRYFASLENAASSSTGYSVIGWSNANKFQISNTSYNGNFASEPAVGDDFAWAMTCSGTAAGNHVGYWRAANSGSWVTTSCQGVTFTSAALFIGNDSYNEWTDADFWNIKVWDRVLTSDELLAESYYKRVVFPASVNFHWPLASTADYYDYSGNGRNPTATGTLADAGSSHGLWVPRRRIFLPAVAAGGATVTPTVGTLRTVGQTPTVGFTHSNAPSVGTLRFVGQTPTVGFTHSVAPTVGTLQFGGQTPGVSFTENVTVTPTVGALQFAGQTPTVGFTHSVAPLVGTVRFDGQTPTVGFTHSVDPTVGTLRFDGQTPTVGLTTSVTPTEGLLRFDGQQPTVGFTHSVAPVVGALRFDGQVPIVQSDGGVTIGPVAGTLRFEGQVPSVTYTDNLVVAPVVGTLRFDGQTPTVLQNTIVAPTAGTVQLIGQTPTVSFTELMMVEPASGSIIIRGQQPTVSGGTTAAEAIPKGGAGYPVDWQARRKKRRPGPNAQLKALLDTVVAEYYGDLTKPSTPPQMRAEAAAIVKPFVAKRQRKVAIPEPEAVDWAALEQDAAKTGRLIALWQKREWERELEAEDELLMLMD